MSKEPYTLLPILELRDLEPAAMLAAIEESGRGVTVVRDMLPSKFNYNGTAVQLAMTTPEMFNLPGGSFRAIDGHIRKNSGLRTMPRFIACNFALTHPLEPMGPDIIIAMDPVLGPDGKPYVFYVCNGNESLRGILDGELCKPTFGAIFVEKPVIADKSRDFIPRNQQLLYLAPVKQE